MNNIENNENVGNASRIYHFEDGDFTFWQAQINDKTVIFRVRQDANPSIRAMEKGIPRGTACFPAEDEKVKKWLESHPDYKLI